MIQHLLKHVAGLPANLNRHVGWKHVVCKLHAPKRTIIEGVYRDGALREFKVSPPERAKDVIKLDPQ